MPREEIRQRLGYIGALPHQRGAAPAWIQAASVGEVGVATGLIAALHRGLTDRVVDPVLQTSAAVSRDGGAGAADRAFAPDRARDDCPVYLTTTTRTGQTLAGRARGTAVSIGYFPLDFRASVRRFLDALRPCVLLLVETEIWPNLLVEAERRRIPVLIVNGRISDRALRRYRLVAPLIGRALRSVRTACVQTPSDASRFARLGLPKDRIRVAGNMKFALSAETRPAGPLLAALGVAEEDEVWIAGSTAEGEEEAVLAAWRALPAPVSGRRILIVAPRRPDRFDAVAKLIAREGLSWIRRSAVGNEVCGGSTYSSAAGGEEADIARESRPKFSAGGTSTEPDRGPAIVLLDTIGELSSIYSAGDVAFVGGTLAPIGGHNVLEPASRGVAPIFGPNVQNIREVASQLLDAGGAFQVPDATALREIFERLANDTGLRRAAGERARKVVAQNAQALETTLREIVAVIAESAPEGPGSKGASIPGDSVRGPRGAA